MTTVLETAPVRAAISSATRIGWIGAGVMGAPMCGHVMDEGYAVTLYSRTKEKAGSLLDQGAGWAASPAEVARQADIVFTMVGFPSDVRQVYFGPEGIFEEAKSGSILCDLTTTEPGLAKEIYEAATRKGIQALDAPVSGGDVGARNATLSIMVGGDKDAFDAMLPILELMGKNIVYEGGAGFGQHTKMCNQITIAGTMIGVCEALLYGHRAGLDLETMLRSISGGAAGCWTLENLAPRILKRNFDPGFFVEHFIKDMGIALAEASRMGIVLPGLALVHQLYLAVRAQGHGKAGTHALFLALERLSALEG